MEVAYEEEMRLLQSKERQKNEWGMRNANVLFAMNIVSHFVIIVWAQLMLIYISYFFLKYI